MGGQALKHCTRRYEKEEFLNLVEKIQQNLVDLLDVRVNLIPYYKSKSSFGDADILVESDHLPTDWKHQIIHFYNLDSTKYRINGDVMSIAVEELQVDLITTQSRYFKSSFDYFSYNDLHNLTGRILHKMGIKHGHKGLSLVIRHKERSDHILSEIFLEHDNAKEISYSILGLDPNFIPNTVDDLFEFVASSTYFDPDIYLLDNRNYVSRVRDRKRANYRGMLDWCGAHPNSKKYNFPEKNERGGYSIREPFYTEIVLKQWPWVEDVVNSLIESFELNLRFSEIYNGSIVSARTGLIGKELGGFMSKMKERYGFTDDMKRKWLQSKETTPLVAIAQMDMEYRMSKS